MKKNYVQGLLIITYKLILYAIVFTKTNLAFGKAHLEPPQRVGSLFLSLTTQSFLKNNEYFGPIVQGHTLVGHHLYPYLWYNPTNHIQVKGGVFMRRDWADTRFFAKVYPTFSIQYQNQAVFFLLGTIDDPYGNQLIKPLYDIERFLERGFESGFQFSYIGRYGRVNIWLEWLSLLDKQANKPEELCAGLVLKHALVDNAKIKLTIPMQLYLYHLGGQNIAIQDYSLLLGAIGGKTSFAMPKHSWLKSIKFESYWVFNRYIKQVARPFKAGQGLYTQLMAKITWLQLAISYWQGQGFISENLGEPIYQSIAWSGGQVSYQEKMRKLLCMDFMCIYQLAEHMTVSLYLAPYYDFNHHCLEHSAGIHITYNPRIAIA